MSTAIPHLLSLTFYNNGYYAQLKVIAVQTVVRVCKLPKHFSYISSLKYFGRKQWMDQ